MFKKGDIITYGYVQNSTGTKEVRLHVNDVTNTNPVTYELHFMGDLVNEKGEYIKLPSFTLPHIDTMKLSEKQLKN